MAALLSGTKHFTLREPSDLCAEQLGCTFLLSIIMINNNNSSKVKGNSELTDCIRWILCSCFQVHRDYFVHLSPSRTSAFAGLAGGLRCRTALYPGNRQPRGSANLCNAQQEKLGQVPPQTSRSGGEKELFQFQRIKAESKTSWKTTFHQ